ncbi:MAG: HIT family protein [Planctomycetota bacterium]
MTLSAPDPNCIFCKIVRGEIPARIVYRDARFVAFLDIHPVSRGHTLLVPTTHVTSLARIDPPALEGLPEVLPALAGAVMRAVGADGLNLLNNTGCSAGQVVEHLHIHLIPRWTRDDVGLLNWRPREVEAAELEGLERRIRDALAGRTA